jgi:hypothetical protein
LRIYQKGEQKMEKQKKLILVLTIVVATFLPVMVLAGDLEPSAAPGPTMKTLDDIYSTNSWSKKLPCDSQANCPRFEVLSDFDNTAVLDRETGLVWEKSPSPDDTNWRNALLRCNDLNLGGRRGWRLPTVQELGSLMDGTRSYRALPSGHPSFQDVQWSYYWSATTYGGETDYASGVWLVDGHSFAAHKNLEHFVWCVRGGQGVDVQ